MKTILNMQINPNLEKMKYCRYGWYFDEMSRPEKKVYRKLRKAREKEVTMKMIANTTPLLHK